MTNPPASAARGSSFSTTDTVKNQGSATAGASTTRYFLSLDATKSGGDVRLNGGRSVLSLAAGAQSTGTVSVTLPASMATGTYFLIVCADDPKAVTESNETNNCLTSTTAVSVTQ